MPRTSVFYQHGGQLESAASASAVQLAYRIGYNKCEMIIWYGSQFMNGLLHDIAFVVFLEVRRLLHCQSSFLIQYLTSVHRPQECIPPVVHKCF